MRYDAISNHLLDRLIKDNRIKESYREIYAYSLEKLFAGFMNAVLLIITTSLLNIRFEAFIFFMFYMPIRKYAGGLHAKTRIWCVTLSLITMITLIKISEMLYRLKYRVIMLVILLLVSNIFIFIFAPVDCDNNKLSSDTKKNHKIISRRIVVMESILIVLCMILLPQINVYMIIATMAMLLVGFTLIPYKLLLGGL